VAAVDLLGVQPQIPLFRVLGGKAVVLPVVAAHQNTQSGGGTELPGLAGPLERGLFSASAPAEIASVGQLGPDVVEVLLALCQRQLLLDALQIHQLGAALFHLLRQVFLRRFGLGIFLKILGGVLLRRQPHIQRDVHIGAVGIIVVLGRQAAHTALHAVEVGGDQFAVHTPLVPIAAVQQFLLLGRQLAADAGG